MPGDPELDELLSRFGAGERTWELGTRLASVLAAAGRTAQVPGILVECRPLRLDAIGAEKIVELTSDARVSFTGWRLPRTLGGSGIIVYDAGRRACDVRMGDSFEIDFGGMGAAVGSVPLRWELVRSMGEKVAEDGGVIDEYMEPGVNSSALFSELLSALETFGAAIGATARRRVE